MSKPEFVDPRPCEEENTCDIEGCYSWTSAGLNWQGSYLHLCSRHARDQFDNKACPPVKARALEREAKRGPDGVLPA